MGFSLNWQRKGNDNYDKEICIHQAQGISHDIRERNDCIRSVGAGDYCDNSFPEDMDFSCSKDASSDTAEVAVIYKGDLIDFIDEFIPEECSTDGTVAGYLSPEDVLYFLNKVKEWKPKN